MMNDTITNNIYPKWNSFGDRSMEKMLLLFADTRKAHAAAGDTEELEKYFSFAEAAGSSFDWVQLHSGYFFNHAPFEKYPDSGIEIDERTNAFLDKAIQICKRNGKKVSYMMGDYSPLECLLERYPQVRNLNNGLFWDLMYDAACGILKRFPDLDELAMYFFESKNLLHYNNFFSCMNYGLDFNEDTLTGHPELVMEQEGKSFPYLSFGDHLRMMLQSVARACRDCGKSFTLLTHVWFPYQEEVLYEALRDFPADLPLLLEHNYTTGDFNPALPAPGLIKRLPHLKHGICFCCGMEYHGLSLVPCCFPEAMEATIHDAMESTFNLKRITVRPIWDGQSLLGSPNEINLYYLLKMADQPDIDPEEIWKEWIQDKYNICDEESAALLASAFRKSYKVVQNVFFEFGVRANDHSHIPDFAHLESRLFNYGKALIKWSPTPENKQNIYDLLIHPGDKILRLHSELHEESLELIEHALEQIKSLEGCMRWKDYEDVVRRYEDMRIWVLLHQDEYESYIRLLIQRRNPTERNRKLAECALISLEEKTKKIRNGEIRSCYLFSIDHIESFIAECRANFSINRR